MSGLYSNFLGYLQLNIPRIKWILLFGLAFFSIFCILEKKGYTKKHKNRLTIMVNGLLLSLNCAFIFVMTLFGRAMGESRSFRLWPFESYGIAFMKGNVEILLQIIVNIAMYVSLSILLLCCFRWLERYRYVVLVAAISSLAVEFIQVIFKIGMFEVDDIISNVFGAGVRVLIFVLVRRLDKEKMTKSI